MKILLSKNDHNDVKECIGKLEEFKDELEELIVSEYVDTSSSESITCVMLTFSACLYAAIRMFDTLGEVALFTVLPGGIISVVISSLLYDSHGVIGSIVNSFRRPRISKIQQTIEVVEEQTQVLTDVYYLLKQFNKASRFVESYDSIEFLAKKKKSKNSTKSVLLMKAARSKKSVDGHLILVEDDELVVELDEDSYYKTINKDTIDFSWLDGELVGKTIKAHRKILDSYSTLVDNKIVKPREHDILALPEFQDQFDAKVVFIED